MTKDNTILRAGIICDFVLHAQCLHVLDPHLRGDDKRGGNFYTGSPPPRGQVFHCEKPGLPCHPREGGDPVKLE